jgi:ethanolamine permease
MSAIMSPFDQGFVLMFKMPKEHAQFLSLPAMFATGYGFIFAYSTVMISMARSGLFPKIFLMTYGRYRTPYMTILSGSLIGYIVLVATYFRPVIGNYLYDICILQGFIAYICQ